MTNQKLFHDMKQIHGNDWRKGCFLDRPTFKCKSVIISVNLRFVNMDFCQADIPGVLYHIHRMVDLRLNLILCNHNHSLIYNKVVIFFFFFLGSVIGRNKPVKWQHNL